MCSRIIRLHECYCVDAGLTTTTPLHILMFVFPFRVFSYFNRKSSVEAKLNEHGVYRVAAISYVHGLEYDPVLQQV